ncbi:MAG TPA: DUF1842 domain-containing protein [Chitinophaga sp.]|uniref:DUF1842 domain-containing protein n=1 Tax=Chitinophaga sp. TaxID=1869181 RepID=UPI002D1BAFB5|nr:DUF1842 domain-containing protein [Chitinophaga sp.]HVI47924.1 DUF1842 domain-containing protein [Chitinophaga sp.]
MASKEIRAGLFAANYRITTGVPGAPVLTLGLTVSTVTHTVTGQGHIFQAVNPSLFFKTDLKGNYYLNPILPPAEYPIHVSLTGWPFIPNPISNVVPHANAFTELVLAADWKSGKCTYRYQDNLEWHVVEDVPVVLVADEVVLHAETV